MSHVLWATLVLVAVAAAALDDSVVAWSLAACQADPPCALRFDLPMGSPPTTYEQQRFAEMMAVFALHSQDGDTGAADLVAMCTNGSATDGCASVQWMWVGMLRQAQVCAPNEEWIVGHGCECLDGKQCDTDCMQRKIADLWSLNVLVALLGLGALALFVSDAQKFSRMRHDIDDRAHRAAVEHYTTQAQLYAADTTATRFAAAAPAAAPPPQAQQSKMMTI
jgi:hypothetical protein